MKKIIVIVICLFFLTEIHATMKLTSSAFTHNTYLPQKYTCDGQGINPPLKWEQVPTATKTFVLLVEDPDAPSAQHPRPEGPWVHWIVFNIPSPVTQIPENGSISELGAAQGINDAKKNNFYGACPPQGSGVHRYFFRLFALDTKLDLAIGATKEQVMRAMQGHIVAQAELIGLYKRN